MLFLITRCSRGCVAIFRSSFASITFYIEDETHLVSAGESLHIPKETKHLIKNDTGEVLSFLVISEPMSHGDRVNI
ncbi:hypothetical protein DBR43_27430 [Pedobacter sp. KBW06]|uniref:cupin domain-containing protein n=1 Tax=Pedobacter sp. KBW06 TaxID=2153359 RepID=UPI000F5B35EB|nr:hypothetical protein DBR43_27430 [Pedobacter sp. KBW06]